MKRKLMLVSSAVLMSLIGSRTASATLIDFSTQLPLGNLSESVTIGGITISAWTVNKTTGTWVSTNVILNNRRELPDELGLGICLSSNCPATGNGNINEIDNNGTTFDVIRLDLGAPVLLNSIGLSSLDSGSKDGFAIFGNNTAQPNLTSSTSLTPIQQGTNLSIAQVTPTININQSYRYFFVTPLSRGANDANSDFMLGSVNTATPEPYTAATLGFGLLAIGAGLRMKLRRQERQAK